MFKKISINYINLFFIDMGSGYIQLFAVGSEFNIFNYNPNISFFKIYYRRHTNFFINNMEINANNLKTSNLINQTINTVTINIPKNGDLLGKSYLYLTLDEHYFELFKFNDELCSTLNIDLLNTYDSYYIKTNNYSINDISNFSIVKINYRKENFKLSILTSNILNQEILLNLIKQQENLKIESDPRNIFYNIDLNILFYSFDVYLNLDILNNELFIYLIKTINYQKLNYIQIDFLVINISLKITYYNNKYYKLLSDLIFSDKFINNVNKIKISINYVYFVMIFSVELYNLLLELMYIETEIFDLEIINNKYKSIKTTYNEQINTKINSIILNKNIDTSIYLSILNGDIKSNTILTVMKKITFFGNLTNEYYNDLLIQNGNKLLNIFNLNNINLSLNLLIKIYISLICYNDKTTIQNYLKIINENKISNISDIYKYYLTNNSLFNEKLIKYLMNSNVLIVSLKTFFIILYTKNIYEKFQTINFVESFTNNNISLYESIINNFYFYNNLISTTNYNFNNVGDDYNNQVSQLIFLNQLTFLPIEQSISNNTLNINYVNNNNLFDIEKKINNQKNILLIIDSKNNNLLNNGIINNILFNMIAQSILTVNYIISFDNYQLYNSNGKLSNIFINTILSTIILPMSSFIYICTDNITNYCFNKITNNMIFYNLNKNNFIDKIKKNLINLTTKYYEENKINIVNSLNSEYYINNFLEKNYFYDIINEYYLETKNFMKIINVKNIDIFMNQIKNIDYNIIYPYFEFTNINLNSKIMYQQFTYVDKNLFNNAFTNFKFKKNFECNEPLYLSSIIDENIYNNFIFTINSPIYRIYFFFTFISKITIDLISLNENYNNDINILRNFTLFFLFDFFKIFNNLNDEDINSDLNIYNFKRMKNDSFYLLNNFICYDNINIFDNKEFNEFLKSDSSNKYVFLYNNFYIIKKYIKAYKINDDEFLENIPDISNNIKYNYDDIIIKLFIDSLIDNKEYFKNIKNIYNFTLDFFNKNDFNFEKIINLIDKYYFASNINKLFLNEENNNFYYNCYYTNFYIGCTFDNINKNNINTINNIVKLTTLYNRENFFNYSYAFKEFNSKQYYDYLNLTENLTKILEYFQIELLNIFNIKLFINKNYYKYYIQIIISYINVNYTYLLLYIISEYNFYNSVSILDKYINIFNNINNSSISLINSIDENINKKYFEKYNFIIIIYYYLYFIYQCLQVDINEFNENIYLKEKYKITFEEFIISKYTLNLYNDCINDLINLYTYNNDKLILDFSTIYIYSTDNNIYKNNINISNNTNNIINLKKNIYVNKLEYNQEIDNINDNLNYSIINNYELYIINENIKKIIFINKNFNILYCESIINTINKINTIFYINDFNKIRQFYLNNKDNLPLIYNYIDQKKYNYDNSIYLLGEIYINLSKSKNTKVKYKNNYDKKIVEYIFYNIKNFYYQKNFNYFNTMYYLFDLDHINKNSSVNNLYNIEIFNDLIYSFDIYTLYSKYVNGLISNSLIYERSINSIIYILSNNFLIDSSFNKNEVIKLLSKYTLYDIVKIYKKPIDEKNLKNKKIYLDNTTIYSNQSIFQIYNYKNFFNNISFTQNYWINYIISNIDIDLNIESNNSYYNLFIKFVNYVKFFELNLFDLILDNGISVLNYFINKENYDEFTDLIFNYICLNDVYSPNLIFENIVDLIKTSNINSKLIIETDYLKKKIIIFLFFTWIILDLTPSLLIKFFEIDNNIVLEYNIEKDNIKDIKLNDVIEYKNNIKIINWSIYQILNMDLIEDNKTLNITNHPDFIKNQFEILYIVEQSKKVCSPIINFNILSNAYVKIYFDVIGNSNIYTNSLNINKIFNPTITNLIYDINVIFNNDQNINNSHQYDLTFHSLKLLDIHYTTVIFDLKNTSNNKLINSSEFTLNSKNKYSKTVINDFNLLYNLSCLLLESYNINYTDLYLNFNSILNYLRKAENSINELFEIFKGYTSKYSLSYELSPEQNTSKYNYFNSKIFNIQKLNKLVYDNNNNLSIITPDDYNIITINTNYGKMYKNFYNKYYSYIYNYNNFLNNYNVIYKKLYEYYTNISKNSTAIKNIKNYDSNLYLWLFIDMIKTFISNVYFNIEDQKSYNYIEVINLIIKLYFTYNYSFRINENISNIDNLKLQKKYYNVPNFINFNEIKKYLLDYYYYQLFSTTNLDDESLNFKNDVKIFFNSIDTKYNYNFIYSQNYLNCIFKFEIIIKFIFYKISTIYNINLKLTNEQIYKLNETLIEFITDYKNIIYYFNLKTINDNNYFKNNKTYNVTIFETVNNIINKELFFNKFSLSLKSLLYWINDKSYEVNIRNVWMENFSNVVFYFYIIDNNQYTINEFILNEITFNYLIKSYIYYIFERNLDYSNNHQNIFLNIYEIVFSNPIKSLFKKENISINPEVINNIISLEFNNNYFSNNEIFLSIIDINKTEDYYNKIFFCINNIFEIILINKWGIINFNVIDNNYNIKIRPSITFYNLYYSYMNWIAENKNNAINLEEYDFEHNYNILVELYILYSLIINVFVIQYIDINNYSLLEQQILLDSHKYLNYGIKIYTLDINSNFSVYMDCLNSNVIPNNSINNYYKKIQNDTIYDSIKYELSKFDKNINNYDEYIYQIYYSQINKLNIENENTLGSNTFYNIIINTLNNLTSNTNYYLKNNNQIIKRIIDTINNNIVLQFTEITNIFGGNENINITANNTSLKKLFNQNNYKQENSQITILTLLNNMIKNNNIYNNFPIILFYYICFITWSTCGLNIKYDINKINDTFYNLANLINNEIINFIDKQDKNDVIINIFFDGLNILLFNNYNNNEFTLGTIDYFNQIINNYYSTISENTIKNLIGINNMDKFYIKNNKIINWKYLLGLVSDFNDSKNIYYIKSINNEFNDYQIQKMLIEYIISLNDGLTNEYGIIKIIDKMELLFDDEIISQYFNYNYKIFIDNFQNLNKQGLLNEMLGLDIINKENNIVHGLKPYIKKSNKKNYIIPIKFFFENYFNSIPLISCMNTNIKIIIYLKNNNIYKNSYNIKLLNLLNITTKLNSDYILLERDERKKLCSNRIDNLIEKNNYYEIIKNIDEINTFNSILNVNFDIELNNSVKELIWTFKLSIGNYEFSLLKDIILNKEFLNNIKNISLDNLINSDFDFIMNTKFYLNGIRRDGINFLDSNTLPNYNKITTLVNPYKYNTKIKLEKKYNTYSFALEPTIFQPSGTINMSNYKIFRIQIQIDKIKFVKYLNNLNTLFNLKDVNFKMFLSTYEYNIVRYQSSLAGLLFIS